MPMLHPLEIGQYVGIGPTRSPHLGPMIKIAGMAADIDHAIDAGRSAQYLAARGSEHAAPQIRLGFGLKAPVIAGHVHRITQGRWHLNERPGISAAMLNDQHLTARLGQPVRNGTARRPSPDNHIISVHHTPPVIRPRVKDAQHRRRRPQVLEARTNRHSTVEQVTDGTFLSIRHLSAACSFPSTRNLPAAVASPVSALIRPAR